MPTEIVSLSEDALKKTEQLLEREGRDDLMLRLGVQPGGCSGLIYQLYFDQRELEGDNVFEYSPKVRVVIDKMSVPYLQGSTLDYSDTLDSSGFKLDNPNAGSSCACGSSFS